MIGSRYPYNFSYSLCSGPRHRKRQRGKHMIPGDKSVPLTLSHVVECLLFHILSCTHGGATGNPKQNNNKNKNKIRAAKINSCMQYHLRSYCPVTSYFFLKHCSFFPYIYQPTSIVSAPESSKSH